MRTMRSADAPHAVVHWPLVTITAETAEVLRQAAESLLDQRHGEARARLQDAVDELTEVLTRSGAAPPNRQDPVG